MAVAEESYPPLAPSLCLAATATVPVTPCTFPLAVPLNSHSALPAGNDEELGDSISLGTLDDAKELSDTKAGEAYLMKYLRNSRRFELLSSQTPRSSSWPLHWGTLWVTPNLFLLLQS